MKNYLPSCLLLAGRSHPKINHHTEIDLRTCLPKVTHRMRTLSFLRGFCLLLVLSFAVTPARLQAQTYDLIIRHGRVIDGTGNPAFFADIAVTNGRVAAIGVINGDAKQEIDAKG